MTEHYHENHFSDLSPNSSSPARLQHDHNKNIKPQFETIEHCSPSSPSSSPSHQGNQGNETPFHPPPYELPFLLTVCLAQFMTQAALCMSIAPMYYIAHSFHSSSPGHRSWFAAAYSLSVGTFILIAGRLGDHYGHKRLFIIGFLWFALWSLLAGFSVYSKTDIFFDCCRAFQGLGPALVIPNALAILGRAYSPGWRKEMVFCFYGALAPCGFVLGGVFSSLLAMRVWWPWAFWVLAVVCLLLAGLGALVIPGFSTSTSIESDEEKENTPIWLRLDLPGAAAGISALVLVNFAWNQAALTGWSTPYTYALLIVGFVLFAAFAFIERRAPRPLLPREALSGDLAWVLGCIATGWSSYGIIIYYFYEFMLGVKGDSPLLATAKWAGAAPVGALAAFGTGFLLSRVPASVLMFASMACFTAGLAVFATVPVHQTYWAQAFVSCLVTSVGMDMSFPSGTLMLSNSMPHHNQGLAASLITTTVNYSISVGLGVAGTVESNVNDGGKDRLRGYRGALYLGTGLAGLGLVVSLAFNVVTWRAYRHKKKTEPDIIP